MAGEEGTFGISLGSDGLGSAFLDFQRQVKALARDGLLIVLCSKNNETDVWDVFDQNPSMMLKRDEIVSYRINWRDKHLNLIDIADELGLSLDSFVFWDDNPVERELVRTKLPMVEVVAVPEDVTQWPSLLSTLASVQAFAITREDELKVFQYRARAKFSQDIETADDKVEFLKSIRMKAKTLELTAHTLQRAHQLVSKTNQFNLRGIRYSQSDLERLINDREAIPLLGSLADTFGDHGIVSLAIAKRVTADVAFLDTFVMSCRVLGRYFESWILHSLVQRLRERHIRYLVAEYLPSPRNAMCRHIVDGFPFVPLGSAVLPQHDIDLGNDGTHGVLDIQTANFPFLMVFEQ